MGIRRIFLNYFYFWLIICLNKLCWIESTSTFYPFTMCTLFYCCRDYFKGRMHTIAFMGLTVSTTTKLKLTRCRLNKFLCFTWVCVLIWRIWLVLWWNLGWLSLKISGCLNLIIITWFIIWINSSRVIKMSRIFIFWPLSCTLFFLKVNSSIWTPLS